MNSQEKALARKLFKLKIHEAKGQAFEDLFTTIMNYSEPNFQSINPWGNIGDRKNDGYIKSKGIFFQVFAPEKIEISYPKVVQKLKVDFTKLLEQWSPVREIYFVLNDAYKGVNADSEQAIQKIKQDHGLEKAGFKTAKDLENVLFSLDDDQIIATIGFLPDPENSQLDYSVLGEVISHLMKMSLERSVDSRLNYPDWNKKIVFNGLGRLAAQYLNTGHFQLGTLDEYLDNQSNFFADEVKGKIREVYVERRKSYSGDELFWKVVDMLSPRAETRYQVTVIVLMAKYFETCDIFEEPM